MNWLKFGARPYLSSRSHAMFFIFGISACLLGLDAYAGPATKRTCFEKCQVGVLGTQTTDSKTPPAEVEFKLLVMSNGVTDDGVITSTLKLATSDGQTVYKTTIPFGNPERAAEEFRKVLKNSDKVIRKSSETDKEGRVLGERILASFPVKNADDFRFKLFWTNQSWFHAIYGNSVDAILELERHIKETKEKPKK